ncbi:MAG TPA: DUF2202 domain-containing protein [Caldithrix abyssi]|uniref:DUF2202 domain-containing protein n=1 Tax=Caldithrix abyssi TaxID=187145 RepID=A0A7V1LPQ0_CALAY|nr:DUF2202 domain-containing protein [Caldithrix abyssi]
MLRSIYTLLALGIFSLALMSCSDSGMEGDHSEASEDIVAHIADLPVEDVNDAEVAGLVYMREEEKLARDVYSMMYAKWDLRVFENISHSEQMHMDAIKVLLDRYEIADPVGENGIGVFQNEDLQKLYDQLIEAGNDSLVGALLVGAAIEEIDIIDLQNEIDNNVDNQDIEYVYSNLMRGSRNHLRAYVKNLDRNNVTYAPQYLSEEEYLDIINSDMEKGECGRDGGHGGHGDRDGHGGNRRGHGGHN